MAIWNQPTHHLFFTLTLFSLLHSFSPKGKARWRSGLYFSSSCDKCDACSWRGIKHEHLFSIILIILFFFSTHKWFQHRRTCCEHQSQHCLKDRAMPRDYTERSFFSRHSCLRPLPLGNVDSSAVPRVIPFLSAVSLWSSTGELHEACFEIIATNTTSCPLIDTKARGNLVPYLFELRYRKRQGIHFPRTGHNAEGIFERISLFVSLWSPTWVEQRTATAQYCYAI